MKALQNRRFPLFDRKNLPATRSVRPVAEAVLTLSSLLGAVAVSWQCSKERVAQIYIVGGAVVGALMMQLTLTGFFLRRRRGGSKHRTVGLSSPTRWKVPTKCSMEWMNNFVSIIWPRAEGWLVELMHNTVAPSISKAAPAALQRSVQFKEVTLGDTKPRLVQLTMERARGVGNIEISIDVNWDSECSVELMVGPIPIQLSRLALSGTTTVVLVTEPPSCQPPFFRGIQVFCANPPSVEVTFGGAASVADFPGIRSVIHQAISGAINKMLVLPNCIAVDMDNTDSTDDADLSCAAPVGVLRLMLHRCTNLQPADLVNVELLASSDPYVTVAIGCQRWQSPVLARTLNPEWATDNVADFLVYDWRQLAEIKVFDDDVLQDDLIGFKGVPVSELQNVDHKELHLRCPAGAGAGPVKLRRSLSSPTSWSSAPIPDRPLHRSTRLSGSDEPEDSVEKGTVELSTRVLSFTNRKERSSGRGPSRAFLSAKIVKAKLSDACWQPPFTVHVQLHVGQKPLGTEASTRPSRGESLKEMPQEIVQACLKLSAMPLEMAEVAEVLGVSVAEVHRQLQMVQDPQAAKLKDGKANALREATEPYFGQVLHLLIPGLEGEIWLELTDKSGKVVGHAAVSVRDLLAHSGGQLHGPFALTAHRTAAKGVGVVHASLSLQRLHDPDVADEVLDVCQEPDTEALPRNAGLGCFSFLTAPGKRAWCG